jgi:hypothetical protein
MNCISRATTNGGQAAYGAAHIDGRALNRMLRGSTASQRAIIADDLRTGRLVVSPLTGPQSRLLTGASYGYAYTASKITDAERVAVKLGKSLSARHAKPSFWAAVARAMDEVFAENDGGDIHGFDDQVLAKVGPTHLYDDAFDRLAARYPNQMMAALDRVTAPTMKTNGNAGHANDNNDALAGQMSFAL